ncbi:large ribosomal subunit protein uL23c-like [Rutidosis leptorrhynchoides]|uniref:large ribosomal subunit protein uL23c-like n=1 Tax=Rutidosis leptorrhynchoides TaxID=125765 RepID=UPI003A996D1E
MAVIFSCSNIITNFRNHYSPSPPKVVVFLKPKNLQIASNLTSSSSSSFAVKASYQNEPKDLQPKRSVAVPTKPEVANFKEPEAEEQSLNFVEAKKSLKEKTVTQTSMDYQQVLKYPIVTEAAIKLITQENTLVFMVDVRADKKDIRNAFENMLKIKTKKINTLINYDGTKKAYIQLSPDNQAATVAKKLKILG